MLVIYKEMVSLVPVGAGAGAGGRRGDIQMSCCSSKAVILNRGIMDPGVSHYLFKGGVQY